MLLFSNYLLSLADEGPAPVRTDDDKKAYKSAMEDADQQIYQEVKAKSELMRNLEYLTYQIGARLTGSPQMQQASDWSLGRFRDYGLDAHLETVQIAHAWRRGSESARLLTPTEHDIPIHAIGWSKATPGAVTGLVTVLQVSSSADVLRYKGKLKGAIVLPGEPAEMPDDVPETAYDAFSPPVHGVPRPEVLPLKTRRQLLLKLLLEEQAAVVLLDSGKTDDLFNMGTFSDYEPTQIPIAFVTHESYSLIYRLAMQSPVTMQINMAGTFSPGPAPASITVAQIRGSEFPDEQVVLGAHLDSWDLGQGALDNGTGAMAVLEAARVLRSLSWKPKRTITFVLFTGEEENGIGAKAFLANHHADIAKIDGVLVHDTGTGRVLGIGLQDLYETGLLMKEIYEPLREVFDLQPLSTRYFGASDHVQFLEAGVPAYFCVQAPAHYREAHHSQTDTFDKVRSSEINQGAALLAAWAWNVSEMPQRLPHH